MIMICTTIYITYLYHINMTLIMSRQFDCTKMYRDMANGKAKTWTRRMEEGFTDAKGVGSMGI